MSHRKYNTKEDYIEAAAKSISLAEMCRKLGLVVAGGNYSTVKKKIAEYDLDVSHFLGHAHARGKVINSTPNRKTTIKKRLLEQRGHRCESCKNTEWLTLPITLELEHIDGNNTNNDYRNLLLLCPNCHSQTKTWRRAKSSFDTTIDPRDICSCGNNKRRQSKVCINCWKAILSNKNSRKKFCSCGEKIDLRSSRCPSCFHDKQKRIDWPNAEVLIANIQRTSFLAVAKELGVSDSAVRKHLRHQGFDPKTFERLELPQ